MSSSSIALTKIRPPRPRAPLVARAVLERKLGEALAARRLTLLVAPAGFGKTAALTRQIALLPADTAVAWIAADEDDDLHRFLACLVAALEAFDLPWRTAPDALVAAAVNARGERRAVAGELVNALAACEAVRGLIVVDDADRIEDKAVFEFVDLLLERLPERWGLAVAGRADPPLALARLRAESDLAEIRQADLRFDREEIAAFVAASGHAGPASESDVTQLLARTRGWAAGLRLTLRTARDGEKAPAQGSARVLDRHVFDYLAAEVLDELTAELRTFLLRCSVLPELTAARCARVAGNPRAAQLLDEIERRELFVSALDGPECTLVLHDLFRACLGDRLRQELADEVPRLLRLAGETEADPIRRLTFLVQAGAWEEAESALDEVAEQLLAGGIVEAVPRLIGQFPPERRDGSPRIALVRALTAWGRWDWPEMIDAVRVAVAGFARLADEPRRQRALVIEAIALSGSGQLSESMAKLATLPDGPCELETLALARLLHAWHALDGGDFGVVAGRYALVLDLLEQIGSERVWFQIFQRPLYVRLPGSTAPLMRFVDGVARRAGDAPTQLRAIANAVAAWLALWRGEIGEAMDLIAAAEAEARWFGMPILLRMYLNTFLAAAHAIRGDREAAMQAVRTLLAYFDDDVQAARRRGRTSMLGHYLFLGLRIADAVGDVQALRELAARMPAPERITHAPMLRAPLLTLPARLAAAEGRHREACVYWAVALADPAAIDVVGLGQEARLRYAGSLLATGRRSEAAAVLRSVCEEVAATGEMGGALLAGPAIVSRLAAAAWCDELAPAQLAQLRDWVRRANAVAPRGDGGGERLSSREMEILQRIARGDTNKLIARAFDLSPHTVKRHVANILDKLAVSSRGEAAQWYRAQA